MAKLEDVTSPAYGDGYVRGLEDGRLDGLNHALYALRKLKAQCRSERSRRYKAIQDCLGEVRALIEGCD